MKRSEMILLIADELEDIYDSWNSGGYTVFEARAKHLLEKIEDAGMLPPEIDVMIEGHQCTDNKWELEDEEK